VKYINNIFVLLVLTCQLIAAPAYRGAREQILADGTVVQLFGHGDELCHFLTLADGTRVRVNEKKMLDTLSTPSEWYSEIQQRAASRRVRQTASTLNLAPLGLIILANFKDVHFTASHDLMDRMHNGENFTDNGATGSVKQYFKAQSAGQYVPQFDVYGPVTLPKNMSYYGANYGTEDAHPKQMIIDACKAAYDTFAIDFSKYDNDHDGMADFVYVVYAGYGEADGGEENTIWPHSWWLDNNQLVLGGTEIHNYACSAELSFDTKQPGSIGTFCHEFSHVLGLPDIYENTYCSQCTWKTSGQWDIMDYGCYNNYGRTPCSYTAYERFFLGWLKPTLVTSTLGVSLTNIQSSNSALLLSETGEHNLVGNDPNPTTFYLLENRQQTKWDKYIPGHGLMLTKIAYDYNRWNNNTVNNTANSLGVDLIEADGYSPSYSNVSSNGFYGKATDLFPAGANSYNAIQPYNLTNIEENNGIVSFNITYATDIADILGSTQGSIQAIYTSFGHLVGTTNLQLLPTGIYLILYTNQTTKKVYIP